MSACRVLERARGTGIALAMTAVGLAGYTSSDETGPPTADGSDLQAFGHVHGLGVNPADDRLYVATHMGVFRQTPDGFERIAERWQDTMSFTIVGPDHFLASGHPDTREDKPAHLGLIESRDAAETWRPLSLEGRADFHALEPAGDRLYGVDSRSGNLMVTTDRANWQSTGRLPAVDIEADPTDPESLLATDPRGVLLRLAQGAEAQRVEGAPGLVLLDWVTVDLLVGVGPGGAVYRSADGGATWRELASLPGPPQAISVTPERWYAATAGGLFQSEDDGRSWVAVDTGRPQTS